MSDAEKNGRSVSEEIEQRIERSIEDEGKVGSHTDDLLRFLATGIRLIEASHGARWMDDEATAVACRALIDASLDAFMRAAASVRRGLLGMSNASSYFDDQREGERLAYAMRRERLRRTRDKRGDEAGALGMEISAIDARLRSMTDPFSESILDLSTVGALPPGPLDGLLSAGKSEAERLKARIAADQARLAELR